MNAAHLHLVFNHLPAGCVLSAVLLGALAWFRENRDWLRAAVACQVAAAVLSLVALLTGGPAAWYILDLGGSSGRSIAKHREYAIYAVAGGIVLSLAGLALTRWAAARPGRGVRGPAAAVFAISLAWLAWLAVTYTVGGMIRHFEVMNCTWF